MIHVSEKERSQYNNIIISFSLDCTVMSKIVLRSRYVYGRRQYLTPKIIR